MANREVKLLDSLMDGAVTERFNSEIERVMQNIYDMRTNPVKPRKITLTFTITPSNDRTVASMAYDVKATLAPPEPIQQTVLMHQRDDGSVIVMERTDQIPGQIDMEGNEQPLPKMIEFQPAAERQ